MFGENPLRKADLSDGSSLTVHSVFGTIQGEGPFSGKPAVFVRLAGCNLACFFCDTEFENGARQVPVEELVDSVRLAANRMTCGLVVITGGEPMRQPITGFVSTLLLIGYRVQIETAGTLWPALFEVPCNHPELGKNLTIVCSPKTGKVHASVVEHCRDWKYIVSTSDILTEDGLPSSSTQREGMRQRIFTPELTRNNTIWLQPREEYLLSRGGYAGRASDREATLRNMQLAGELAMKYGYRLTLQTHKLLGLP